MVAVIAAKGRTSAGRLHVADIFISYTSSDRDWAFWIGHELKALGHTPRIDEWEISGGGNIMVWMLERHHAADRVLCVVSSEYLTKPYSSLENTAAQWAAVKDRPNFLLPVFIEPCEAPTLLAPLKRCDLYDITEEDARTRLKTFLEPAAPPARVGFPGGAKASSAQTTAQLGPRFPGKAPSANVPQTTLSNVSISVPLHFMGRGGELAKIEKALAKKLKGRVSIVVLHGMRGVGKTTLATAYAEKHRDDYRATWWIRAQADSTTHADLVELGVRLGWVAADEKEEPALNAVTERLRHEGEGILLIFDNAINANALKPYLPRGGAARILVTSNAHAWRGVAVPVEIRQWPKKIGADYLVARTGHAAERSAAEALSEALGGQSA
jgi:TIR domain/AAA ATPase domain